MNARRPYRRPMTGWWRKNPYFVEYMIHEGTALAVAAYALVLLAGLIALARGEAAWTAWLSLLQSAPMLILHGVLLLGFVYHTWTWFHIMPRTLPPILIGGSRVAGSTITRAGLAAALLASALVYIVVARLAP
ncbi:MAG: fumarate reductase subunit C [Rhodanobacteraceae bacterium]|nr:fumarate reductase subunit C [Rhodanobacteraceae bacterium]